MQLNLSEFLETSISFKETRKVNKEDIVYLFNEINKRHNLSLSDQPLGSSVLLAFLFQWQKANFFRLKKRVEQLNALSLRKDITRQREFFEFFAVSYLYFFRIGIPFSFTQK